MKIEILGEYGYDFALRGIALNKEQTGKDMTAVALKLSQAREGSHRKFLRQMCVWLEITAPIFWWTELDTYQIGATRNSGSTMHNLHKKNFEQSDFCQSIPYEMLISLQCAWDDFILGNMSIGDLKALIPSGYIQTSVVLVNYEALRTMIADRKNHRLSEWRTFCDVILAGVEHPELLRACPCGE